MNFDFSSVSSKGKILLRHENKSFTNANGRIMKCYWSCINKSCSRKINYFVNAQMDHPINVAIVEHDNGLCHTDEIGVIRRAAKTNIMSMASQGISSCSAIAISLG